MPYIEVEGVIPDGLPAFTNYQVYNTLDSAITAQLLPVMKESLNDNTSVTYKREMNVLALCLEMSSKGFPIDQLCLGNLLFSLQKQSRRCLEVLHKYCAAVGFRPINPRSPIDVPALLYTHLGIPEIFEFDRKTNKRKVSTDIKALEKLRTNYPVTRPFVAAIIAYRETTKLEAVFKRGLEPRTQNLRCNFSPSGTETGRLSSQQNPYGRGTNAQNLTDEARQAITAPPGFAILNFDLKTAESFAVGYISEDEAYIAACAGDLHTRVCQLVWPQLPWVMEKKGDRKIAEQPYYRHFSYRDQAKRGGHGTNYYGTPRTLAGILNIPIRPIEEFQRLYLGAFPGIGDWHVRTIARVQQTGTITTRLGRERRFWGRADDAATWREAIAFEPQSLVADIMNEGLLQAQLWIKSQLPEAKMALGRNGKLLPFRPKADLRAQVHDAGVFLVPLDGIDEIARELGERLKRPVDFGRLGTMLIPNDVSIGKRWCKKPKTPGLDRYRDEGLADWTPGEPIHWQDK